MDKIIDFFKNLTWDKIKELLTRWYVIVFIACFLVLLLYFISIFIISKRKDKKIILSKHSSVVRLFAIHYEEEYVYSIDKFNFRKKKKLPLSWFYDSFTPQEKLRLTVWLNELQKEDHKVPHHLELQVKVKNIKQPIFCVISVSSINYKDKVIHMESRLFPNIKKVSKLSKKNCKNAVFAYKELPEVCKSHVNSPLNTFLIRLFTTNELDEPDSRVNHLVSTLIMSRLVRHCNESRVISLINSNEIVLVDFKISSKTEAFAFAHTLSNEISKVLFLSSIYDDFDYKIGVVQRKQNVNNIFDEIKIARETSVIASSEDSDINTIFYDETINKHDTNKEEIFKDIHNKMDKRMFSCTYTPILNTYDGSIFGYQCQLFAPNALVSSIENMQEYALERNFLTELNRILYIETNQVFNFSKNAPNRFVYTTMDLKPSQYLSYIDFYTHFEAPKQVRTIFVIEDNDLIEDQAKGFEILKELKKVDMCLGLKVTSTSLELTPELMKLFDFFMLYEENFPNRFEAQAQILYDDMISRLSFYSGQIIALGVSSWTLIDNACKNKIKHISSPLFGQNNKELPVIDFKKTSKLVNFGKHY